MTAWINLMPNGRYALLAPHESLPKLYREIATFATHQDAKHYARERFVLLAKQYKKPKDASGPLSRPDYGAAQPRTSGQRPIHFHWVKRLRAWRYMISIPQELRPILGGSAFNKIIGSMSYEEAQKIAKMWAARDKATIKRLRAELKLSQDRAATASACDAP